MIVFSGKKERGGVTFADIVPSCNMRKLLIHSFIIISISCLVLFFPAYLRYSDLAGTNLFPLDRAFENPDQDDQVKAAQHDPDVAFLGACSTPPFLEISLTQRFFHSAMQFRYPDEQVSVLRC